MSELINFPEYLLLFTLCLTSIVYVYKATHFIRVDNISWAYCRHDIIYYSPEQVLIMLKLLLKRIKRTVKSAKNGTEVR